MGKNIVLLFIVLVRLLTSGCSTENVSSTQNTLEPQEQAMKAVLLKDEDFIIKDENNYFKLGDGYKNLVTNESVISISEATVNRAYASYMYESFFVSVGVEIFRISITSPMLETSRGIRVGDTMEKVIEKYGGAGYQKLLDTTECCSYGCGAKFVSFYFDSNQRVSSIEMWII